MNDILNTKCSNIFDIIKCCMKVIRNYIIIKSVRKQVSRRLAKNNIEY